MRQRSEYEVITSLKASRIEHANTFANLLWRAGATVSLERNDAEREIRIQFEIGPHKGWTDFWARPRLSSFMVHWYGERKYPLNFAGIIRGSVNNYHGCKATAAYDTYADLQIHTIGAIETLKADWSRFEGATFDQEGMRIHGIWWKLPDKWFWQKGEEKRGPFETREKAEEDFIHEND